MARLLLVAVVLAAAWTQPRSSAWTMCPSPARRTQSPSSPSSSRMPRSSWHFSGRRVPLLLRRPSPRNPSGSVRMSPSDVEKDDATTTTTAVATPGAKYRHTLAILTMPKSTSARIANEAILYRAMSVTTGRLSVVLRTNTGGTSSRDGEGHNPATITQLRRYAGEIYSMAWDAALGLDERESEAAASDDGGDAVAGPVAGGMKLLDVIVYPQNLPNAAPESWIADRPDLGCICSHDSITGWVTSPDTGAGGSGRKYAAIEGRGRGGLAEHVDAVNADRAARGLEPVVALHVDDWPDGAEVTDDPHVVFLEDEDAFDIEARRGASPSAVAGRNDDDDDDDDDDGGGLIGGTPIPPASLYSSVAVGGTFDGMHYGHRKLLTLAISSVQPRTGRLLIGVTKDEMLTSKAYSERIPLIDERIAGVLEFIGELAPGMKNRIRAVPIEDEYGPPGNDESGDGGSYPGIKNDFDALILSHETLPTGRKLNLRRTRDLGMEPLTLLCTQRTEPHGMSSTALRRMRAD